MNKNLFWLGLGFQAIQFCLLLCVGLFFLMMNLTITMIMVGVWVIVNLASVVCIVIGLLQNK